MFQATPSHIAIFNKIKAKDGSLRIVAVAGAGKTSTVVEALKYIAETDSVVMLAFNKNIADEMKRRVPSFVKVATFHSICFATLRNHCRYVQLDDNKTYNLSKAILRNDMSAYYGFCSKLLGYAKSWGIGDGPHALMPNVPQSYYQIIAHFEMTFDQVPGGISNEEEATYQAIKYTQEMLKASVDLGKSSIDYDDMIYLPLIWGLGFQKNDWVFIDEAQDTNGVQRALLHRMLKDNGRLGCVGDPHQSIYGFRGADSSAMDLLKVEFNCTDFPLTVSYRCPKAVVEQARTFVNHIEAHPNAPEGKVSRPERYSIKSDFGPRDAILCRLNAPLIEMAYAVMKEKMGVRVLGRDIGKGLSSLIKKMEAKTLEDLEHKLEVYKTRETAKLAEQGKDAQIESLNDKVECIHHLMKMVPETDLTINRLLGIIAELFVDKGEGCLTLSTVHKAKGLEWDKVFILDADKYMPSKAARQPWQRQQEINLCYVAATRAKKELVYIKKEGRQEVAPLLKAKVVRKELPEWLLEEAKGN